MISFNIRWVGREDAGLTVREYRELKKETWLGIGKYWHQTMLKRHFVANAHRRYGYQVRTQKWRDRKRRAKQSGRARGGAEQDLLYTGDLAARTKAAITLKAFPSRVRLQLGGPEYLRQKPKGSRPDMAAEIFRVHDTEWKFLTNRAVRIAEKVLERIMRQRKVRKKL